jgi:hypothetical protein
MQPSKEWKGFVYATCDGGTVKGGEFIPDVPIGKTVEQQAHEDAPYREAKSRDEFHRIADSLRIVDDKLVRK